MEMTHKTEIETKSRTKVGFFPTFTIFLMWLAVLVIPSIFAFYIVIDHINIDVCGTNPFFTVRGYLISSIIMNVAFHIFFAIIFKSEINTKQEDSWYKCFKWCHGIAKILMIIFMIVIIVFGGIILFQYNIDCINTQEIKIAVGYWALSVVTLLIQICSIIYFRIKTSSLNNNKEVV